jgi:hypothetical protein
MRDRLVRMHSEAIGRLSDADILASSLAAQSDSQAIIRILAFEVLLKAACLASGVEPPRTHDYNRIWGELPLSAQDEILMFAQGRMPGHTDFTRLDNILTDYKFVFERARYYYELYENVSLEQQRRVGEEWEARGALEQEAAVRYHPLELQCLTEGLIAYVERAL